MGYWFKVRRLSHVIRLIKRIEVIDEARIIIY